MAEIISGAEFARKKYELEAENPSSGLREAEARALILFPNNERGRELYLKRLSKTGLTEQERKELTDLFTEERMRKSS